MLFLVYAYQCVRLKTDEPSACLQSGMKSFNGAFSRRPDDQCLLDCPGFISQNRKQQGRLQFVRSALHRALLHTKQRTVLSQPELRVNSTWTRFAVVPFHAKTNVSLNASVAVRS